MKSKVGLFFIYLGLILLVIFFATDQALHPAYGYFFGGLVLLFLGIYMYLRGRKPPEPNTERFRTLRRWRERQASREEKRAERKRQ